MYSLPYAAKVCFHISTLSQARFLLFGHLSSQDRFVVDNVGTESPYFYLSDLKIAPQNDFDVSD